MANSIWVDTSPSAQTQLVGPAADNTAAPPFTFTNDPTTGLGSSAVSTLDFMIAGTGRARLTSTLFTLLNSVKLAFSAGTQWIESALGTLAMVSSAATNQIQIPNGSNPEFGSAGWVSNVWSMGNTTNGGTTRSAQVFSAGAINMAPQGVNMWQFSAAGNLLASTDNTSDIGASGATRPRNVFAGTRVTAPAYTVGATVGASGTGTVLTQLTVVNGIVTSLTIA